MRKKSQSLISHGAKQVKDQLIEKLSTTESQDKATVGQILTTNSKSDVSIMDKELQNALAWYAANDKKRLVNWVKIILCLLPEWIWGILKGVGLC